VRSTRTQTRHITSVEARLLVAVAAVPVRLWSYSTTIAAGWKVWTTTEPGVMLEFLGTRRNRCNADCDVVHDRRLRIQERQALHSV
jgi:hypothetical protein